MRKNKIPGLKRYTDPKTGKEYVYHRASRTRLRSEFGSSAFFEELAKLTDKRTLPKAPLPGTIGLLFAAYKGSSAFTDLAPATKRSYQHMIGLLKSVDAMPLTDLTSVKVAEIRDSIASKTGSRSANFVLAVLSVALEFGRERGIVDTNPTRGIKRKKRLKRAIPANRPWTLAERLTVLQRAPEALRVPIAIAMFTGLRKGDVIALTKKAITDGKIAVTTHKTGARLMLPIHPDLWSILTATPPHEASTVAATSRSTPWTDGGFSASFGKLIAKLQAEQLVGAGLTFHGLRHTVATMLIEAGASTDMVRRILGQRTLAMAQHYSEHADTSLAAQGLILDFDPLGRK